MVFVAHHPVSHVEIPINALSLSATNGALCYRWRKYRLFHFSPLFRVYRSKPSNSSPELVRYVPLRTPRDALYAHVLGIGTSHTQHDLPAEYARYRELAPLDVDTQ
jgi:hypothetical protein